MQMAAERLNNSLDGILRATIRLQFDCYKDSLYCNSLKVIRPDIIYIMYADDTVFIEQYP